MSEIQATNTFASPPTNIPQQQLATLAPTLTPRPPIQVEFYHLRFEYTNTSDWATLELLNPEIIAAVRLVRVTGNPEEAFLSSNILNIYRPVNTISENPEATIIFDAVILPEYINSEIQILSQHGAINGSGIKIWNITSENEEILLQEINHYWVDPKNENTSAWKTQINLLPLSNYKPITEKIAQQEDVTKMVWAFYYGWHMPIYSWMWWDNPKWTDKPILEYNSSDPVVIKQQIEQAKSVGIDGFIYATPSVNDPALMKNFNAMLDLAEQLDFKVLSSVDLLLLDYGTDLKSNVLNNLKTFFNNQYQHPAYMKIDGKPVIQLYSTGNLSRNDWIEIFGELESKGYEGIYLSDIGIKDEDLFQGYYYYAVNGFPNLQDAYLSMSKQTTYSVLLSEPSRKKMWIATVQPGFDNTPISNDPVTPWYGYTPEIIDRANGDFYRNCWNTAISSNPDWIFITSWNEWQENTQIEPSQLFGDYYLQLTAEYIAKWKGE